MRICDCTDPSYKYICECTMHIVCTPSSGRLIRPLFFSSFFFHFSSSMFPYLIFSVFAFHSSLILLFSFHFQSSTLLGFPLYFWFPISSLYVPLPLSHSPLPTFNLPSSSSLFPLSFFLSSDLSTPSNYLPSRSFVVSDEWFVCETVHQRAGQTEIRLCMS